MIRLGLINNYTGDINPVRLKFLRQVFQESQIAFDIIPYTKFRNPDILEHLKKIDAFISTGSRDNLSNSQVVQTRQAQFEFIRQNQKPMLGICFGHQMIGAAYGTRVQPMQKEILESEWDQTINMNFSKDFPLLKNQSTFKRTILVEEFHHEEIIPTEKFLQTFENYASSPSCRIQAIKHKEKPLFGLQFHPDTTKENVKPDALLILHNFFEIIKSSQ